MRQTDQLADESLAINDGLRTLGLVRPHTRGFEVYVAGDAGELTYVGKVDSKSEAIAILRERSVKAGAPR